MDHEEDVTAVSARSPSEMGWCKILGDGSVSVEHHFSGRKWLSAPARVGLLLNESCCDRKLGKFYLLCNPPKEPKMPFTSIDSEAFLLERAQGELFFVYEGWTDDSQATYRSMKIEEKLSWLNAHLGRLQDDVPGVLINTNIDRVKMKKVRFNGMTQAPVTILITPKLYVGMTEQIKQDCHRVVTRAPNKEIRNCYWEVNDSGSNMLGAWNVAGLGQMLDEIARLYLEEDDSLVLFGTAKRLLLQAQTRASLLRGQGEGEKTTAVEEADQSGDP